MASKNRNMNKFFPTQSVIALLSTFQARSEHALHFALLCGAILTALVQPVNSYVKNEEALQLYDEGLRDAFRGDVDEAISAFKRAATLDNTLADAHAYLGMLYGIRGQWKDAIRVFHDAIQADPAYVEVYTELGEAYLNALGNVDQAISPLEKAVELHPNDERARRLLGTAYLRVNRIDEAKHELQKALELNQTEVDAIYNLGLAHFREGEFEAASSHFKQLLKYDPLHAQAHFNLGNCLARTGQRAESKKTLQTFEKLRVQEEQLKHLDRLVSRHPKDPAVWRQLGLLRLERREWDNAVTALEECIALAPKETRCQEALGFLYAQLKDYEKAKQIYESIVRIHPDTPEYRHSLGLVHYMLADYPLAIEQFQTTIRLAPSNPRYHASLANAYKLAGEEAKAAEHYQHYRELQSQRKK